MPDPKWNPRERFSRLVGAVLITEGVLVAILRFLSLVYVVASQAYNADRFRTPLPAFLPWVLITAVVSFVLIWAGSFLRRTPEGAWAEVGTAARVDLIGACLLNIVALAWAVAGLARSPEQIEGTIVWVVVCLASLTSIVGIIRDATTRRATA